MTAPAFSLSFSRPARDACVEGVALVALVAAIAAFAYAPRAGRARALEKELALATAENERLGSRLAGQGDVALEMRSLEDVAARFRAARLKPGLRGETSARLRGAATRLGLSIAREGAWSGTPAGDAAVTLLRKELSLRGPFAACEAFIAEIESREEGFVIERLSVRRERGGEGEAGRPPHHAGVAVELRLLAVEGRSAGAKP